MPRRLTYLQARLLLLLLGVGVAVTQTLLAYFRGAEPLEILAPTLYIPVFAGAIFLFLPGGLVAAALSSTIYGVLRYEQLSVIGVGTFRGLLITRVATYFFFAFVMASGTRHIEGRLRKLELHDVVDDLTGVYNSAFFLQNTDLETSRANRYRSIFSVSTLDVDRAAFERLSRRRYRRAVRDLAHRIRDAARKVDRVVRVDDGTRDRFFLILPETGEEGSRVFSDRLGEAARTFLASRGCDVDGRIDTSSITYPDRPDLLEELRRDVARVEAARRAIRSEGGPSA